MAASRFVMDVRGIPELVWQCRRELADLLRGEAEAESDPRVARRLRAVAALFEAGQARGLDG